MEPTKTALALFMLLLSTSSHLSSAHYPPESGAGWEPHPGNSRNRQPPEAKRKKKGDIGRKRCTKPYLGHLLRFLCSQGSGILLPRPRRASPVGASLLPGRMPGRMTSSRRTTNIALSLTLLSAKPPPPARFRCVVLYSTIPVQ